MSNKTDKLLQRVAFRLPNEKYEKINSVLEDGKYNSQSNFLRSAVDLLLFWEKKIKRNDVTDSKLRESIGVRIAEVGQEHDRLLELREELRKQAEEDLKTLKELKKETEERKEAGKYFKTYLPLVNEHEKRIRREGLEIVAFFMQLIKNLYSQFEDEDSPLKIKAWELQTLTEAKRILENVSTEENKKTPKSNLKRNKASKGLTAKDFFNTVDSSQFKKKEKKSN